MEFLKWIGYIIVSTIGLCVLGIVIAILWMFGTIIGAVFLGLFVVLFVAMAIKDFIESP